MLSAHCCRFTTGHKLRQKRKQTKMDRRRRLYSFAIFLICCYAIFTMLTLNGHDLLLPSKAINSKEDADGVPQEDPELIKYARKNYLIPPAQNEAHYALTATKDVQDPSMGQSNKIRLALKNKTGGFFIECGALDGETRSNTLYMERFLGWKGLLVEADPANVNLVKKVNRKAWLAPTCLSIKPYPVTVSYIPNWSIGKISAIVNDSDNSAKEVPQFSQFVPKKVLLQCIPITTLLLALNVTHVDYFSLDVEGNELEVLRTIDFDKFDITTLSVEFKERKNETREFMKSKGYRVHSEVYASAHWANDFIFVKNGK